MATRRSTLVPDCCCYAGYSTTPHAYCHEKNTEQGCLKLTRRRMEGNGYKINRNFGKLCALRLARNSLSTEEQGQMRLCMHQLDTQLHGKAAPHSPSSTPNKQTYPTQVSQREAGHNMTESTSSLKKEPKIPSTCPV
ncbi:hypothetical protein AVEN_116514-1 [Araneus ventricosus]|uniref:Uncharacterized protein n=1 Tax=Araneus ventricosus TaxID=182803 RepID=A0A4Y2AFA0_ARAVE|nr:hypothetical protein AVEN_116514-1 [Araneus ventricosus]